MPRPQPRHIHFLGIAGSGMSAVAQIAAAQGYEISGCDLNLDSPYFSHLKTRYPQLKAYTGHHSDHLKHADLLAVTPAVFYQNQNHPEIVEAKRRNILIKWQDFMGTYLHRDKFVIAVAGTHGKSTTTAVTGQLLEAAGLDPTVEVGATVTAWHNNVRIGKSRYFVSEADEFHDNFATYHPDIILLTLLEYDHPEYFGSVETMLETYQRFINRLKPGGTVIYNSASPLTRRLRFPSNSLPYSLSQAHKITLSRTGNHFSFLGNSYQLQLPGRHNILNSLAVIRLAGILNLDPRITATTLAGFDGIGRRLEYLGTNRGIRIYDDYANHPSSYAASLAAVRQLHPGSRIIAVIEPHTFSRLRVMLDQLPQALRAADEIIVSRIFASRETDPGDFTGADIVTATHHPSACYLPEFVDIVTRLAAHTHRPDVILVMGSGRSHLLARQILAGL